MCTFTECLISYLTLFGNCTMESKRINMQPFYELPRTAESFLNVHTYDNKYASGKQNSHNK